MINGSKTDVVVAVLVLCGLTLVTGCAERDGILDYRVGDAQSDALCLSPVPPSDTIEEFAQGDTMVRVLWVKGALCQFDDGGQLVSSFVSSSGDQKSTHTYVRFGGTFLTSREFGTSESVNRAREENAVLQSDRMLLYVFIAAFVLGAALVGLRRAKRPRSKPQVRFVRDKSKVFPWVDGVHPDYGLLRGLGVGAGLSLANGLPLNVVETDWDEESARRWLSGSWGVFSAQGLEAQVLGLLEHGHSELFDVMIFNHLFPSEQLQQREDDIASDWAEPTELEEFRANLGPAIEGLKALGWLTSDEDVLRGTKAYDLDRAVTLIRFGHGAKMLSTMRATELILAVASHAQHHRHFRSWRDFGASVLLGRAIWGGFETRDGAMAERIELIGKLVEHPDSPWKIAGWFPEQTDHTEEEPSVDDSDEETWLN